MIKNVLFDLDGTLLPLDQDEFAKEYFRFLGEHVAQYVEPKKFIMQLLKSTEAMVKNQDGTKSNQEIFFADFLPKIGIPEEILLPVLDAFYEHHFGKIRKVVRPSNAARQAVQTAISHGCDIVVATNPIFPANAVRQRIEWAGLGDINFKLVTSFEISHYCKPYPEYYLEIMDLIGCLPENCLMIGNDVEEDLIAGTVGMKTYLVTDCLINTKGLDINADYSGSLENMAQSLPAIINRLPLY